MQALKRLQTVGKPVLHWNPQLPAVHVATALVGAAGHSDALQQPVDATQPPSAHIFWPVGQRGGGGGGGQGGGGGHEPQSRHRNSGALAVPRGRSGGAGFELQLAERTIGTRAAAHDQRAEKRNRTPQAVLLSGSTSLFTRFAARPARGPAHLNAERSRLSLEFPCNRGVFGAPRTNFTDDSATLSYSEDPAAAVVGVARTGRFARTSDVDCTTCAPVETPATMPKPSARSFFVNAPVDFAAIGGLSIVVLLFYRFFPAANTTDRLVGAGIATVLVNWPHFAATSVRLYGSRATLSQYPATALLAPLLCAAGVAASLASPLLFAPVFIKVFLLWSPFHYSGQTIGITMLYARRHGFRIGALTRLALTGFVYLTFISQTAYSEVVPTGQLYSGIRVPSFGIAAWMPSVFRTSMYGFAVAAVVSLAIDSLRARRPPPLMLFVPATAQYVWFIPGASLLAFRELVPAFHSLQYLLVAWSMDLHERFARGDVEPGRTFVLSRSWRWAAANVFGGAALFWALPRGAIRLGADPAVAIGVLAAAVQVHHFLVDGVIWKLKSAAVSSPLLLTVHDLLAGEREGERALHQAGEPAL